MQSGAQTWLHPHTTNRIQRDLKIYYSKIKKKVSTDDTTTNWLNSLKQEEELLTRNSRH